MFREILSPKREHVSGIKFPIQRVYGAFIRRLLASMLPYTGCGILMRKPCLFHICILTLARHMLIMRISPAVSGLL